MELFESMYRYMYSYAIYMYIQGRGECGAKRVEKTVVLIENNFAYWYSEKGGGQDQ